MQTEGRGRGGGEAHLERGGGGADSVSARGAGGTERVASPRGLRGQRSARGRHSSLEYFYREKENLHRENDPLRPLTGKRSNPLRIGVDLSSLFLFG